MSLTGGDDFVFILVSRGQTTLVDVACPGNFNLLAQQILASVSFWRTETPKRQSIPEKTGAFYFHLLVQDGMGFLVCAKSQVKIGVCFSLLEEIRARFLGNFDEAVIEKSMAYSTHFLDFKRTLRELSVKVCAPTLISSPSQRFSPHQWSGVEHSDEKTSVVTEKIEEAKRVMKVAATVLLAFLLTDCFFKRTTLRS